MFRTPRRILPHSPPVCGSCARPDSFCLGAGESAADLEDNDGSLVCLRKTDDWPGNLPCGILVKIFHRLPEIPLIGDALWPWSTLLAFAKIVVRRLWRW